MDVVLDLDLDFFVWPISNAPRWSAEQRAPPDAVSRIASESDVRAFLENQCSLSRHRPVVGRRLVGHDEAFHTWRDWIASGTLRTPFRVVHVDAHADLGLGERSHVYLTTELLALDVGERRDPRRGPDAMGEGSYLAFALANRWISELVYVFPVEDATAAARREADLREWSRMTGLPGTADDSPPPAADLMAMYFRDCDSRTKIIELKRYATPGDAERAAGCDRPLPTPIGHEPAVAFEAVEGPALHLAGVTHMVVAQSPRFTPEAADILLPIISEYFRVDANVSKC